MVDKSNILCTHFLKSQQFLLRSHISLGFFFNLIMYLQAISGSSIFVKINSLLTTINFILPSGFSMIIVKFICLHETNNLSFFLVSKSRRVQWFFSTISPTMKKDGYR